MQHATSGGTQAIRRPTIKDVGRVAGVAASTVSRVLNGGYVSPESREKVLEAIRKLNYQPSRLARGLQTGRTETIALVLPDITNPFFPAIARGVEDAASAQGYTVVLCNTDGDANQELAYQRLLREHRVDGIILTSCSPANQGRWAELAREHPLVLMDRVPEGTPADAVVVDNIAGAYEATMHLIQLGHRRIGFIGGPPDLPTSQERLQGYESALRARGLRVDSSLVRAGDFRYESGYVRMRELLAEDVTAVFAANDLMAIGAMRAVEEAGKRVPRDVAVVGFDDVMLASMVTPRLTTVSQPAYQMGVLAADMLLERLRGESPAGPQRKVLQPTLVIRESCGGQGERYAT